MQTTPYTVWWAPHGVAVVSMPAQIDRANCAEVHAALMQAVDSGAAVIVADLTKTDFCGHAATVTLVSAHALAAQAGVRLRVAAARPNARLMGQIAGTGHGLDLYRNLTTALAGPRSRGIICVRTATGYRRRVIPDEDARRSAGKLARSLSVARLACHAPPPRPPTAPA
jgi:anti-anti-sigma regulatory factor